MELILLSADKPLDLGATVKDGGHNVEADDDWRLVTKRI